MTVKPKGLTGNGPKKVVFKGENIHKGPKWKIS
jgi:polygalacturonase